MLVTAAAASLVAGVGAGVQVVLADAGARPASAAPFDVGDATPAAGLMAVPSSSPSSSPAPSTTTTVERRSPSSTRASRKKKTSTPTTRRTAATKPRTTSPSPSRTTSAPSAGSSVASTVVALTNDERRKHGCTSLSVDSRLTTAAQGHSADMAQHDYFSHTGRDGRSPFDRMRDAGYRYSTAGENIAAGQRTAAAVVEGWMNSAGHRANILNCQFTQIGVGYAKGGSYGTYWTQDFGRPA